MISVSCPHCRAAAELDLVVGSRRNDCASCGSSYWVALAEPTVSTTPLDGNSAPTSSTVVDLGSGIETQATVVGLQAVPEKKREALRETRAGAEVEDLVTERRGVLKGERPSRASRHSASKVSARKPTPSPALELAAPAGAVEAGMTLGGLHLLARIGAGGMGTVWLARQMSLDRNVAVKVLRPSLGNDPAFVIQFTREALAAAQLVHHNIAQIYDIGLDHGLHFFSMEYVDGEPLSKVVKREGRLDPEVAAGYILQAARGLKFAHDKGLVHRDVKPDNLLLNNDGIVKVADLGLVKRLDGREKPVKVAPSATVADLDFVSTDVIMGSPAYMAPEQVIDATKVDPRTDVYSLGCSLYELLTGRPPFEGESTGQVLSQHIMEPPTPPEELNHRVSKPLSQMVLKMMAKKKEDRYADMGAVVTAFERFLGIDGAVFSPREEHAALLERNVASFNDSTWAKRRRLGRIVLFALAGALVLVSAALGFGRFAAWSFVLIGTATVTSFLINAVAQRASMLSRLRHLVLGAPLWTWGVGSALVGLGIGLLAWFGHLRSVAENVGIAAAVGLASFLLLDRRVARERRPFVHEVEEMLKSMRLRGLEEQKLRQFVCKYSGVRWEEFYEALFGYDAKIEARARWGRDEKGLPRKRHGAWRDPLMRFIERRLELRRKKKESAQLASVEQGKPPQPAAS